MLNTYRLYREYKYQFKTEAGSEYEVQLEDYKDLSGIPYPLACELMQLSIKVKDKAEWENDAKIGDTIISIALNYLRRYNDMICYICSNESGREHIRHRLFHKWFDAHNSGDFRRESRIVHNEEHIFIYNHHNESAKHFLTSLP